MQVQILISHKKFLNVHQRSLVLEFGLRNLDIRHNNMSFCFQCKEGACTLSAMTSGIRRNWIQAIMKNVRPTIPPDVTR